MLSLDLSPLMGKLNLFFKICQMYINYTECIKNK